FTLLSPRNISTSEVETSPTMKVDDVDKETPCMEDEYYYKDIQDINDQLYVQFLKQQEKVLSLSGRINSSEEETRVLQVKLVKSKAQICGLEDEKKSLLDRMCFLERACLDKENLK
ncbi:unnamed protein product, partial [Ilex paraguariensis]